MPDYSAPILDGRGMLGLPALPSSSKLVKWKEGKSGGSLKDLTKVFNEKKAESEETNYGNAKTAPTETNAPEEFRAKSCHRAIRLPDSYRSR